MRISCSCKRLEVINRLATDVYGTTEAPFLAEYTRWQHYGGSIAF